MNPIDLCETVENGESNQTIPAALGQLFFSVDGDDDDDDDDDDDQTIPAALGYFFLLMVMMITSGLCIGEREEGH